MIFNMSVGYNLEGIQKPNVQWYLDTMADASEYLPGLPRRRGRADTPSVRDIEIPSKRLGHDHPLDDARLSARGDREHLPLPPRRTQPAHVGEVQSRPFWARIVCAAIINDELSLQRT